MKRLAVLSLLCAALSAQTVTVQIVVKRGLIEKIIWNILLRPKTILSALTCNATEMEPGDSATCTVTLNQAARGNGVTAEVMLPAGFSGPLSVTIPNGSAVATFQITRQDVIASTDPRLFTVAFSARMEGCATQRFSSVVMACCARTDRCGLRASEIAWEPCAGE